MYRVEQHLNVTLHLSMLSGSLLDMLTIIFVEMYDFSLTMQSKLHWMAVWAPCQHVSIWIEHRMEEIEACIADSSSAQPICQQTKHALFPAVSFASPILSTETCRIKAALHRSSSQYTSGLVKIIHQLLNPFNFSFRSALLASMPSSSFAVLFSYFTN